jgi:hypothetical protein
MKYYCTKCEKPQSLIIKMGGLICSKCRVILYFPYDKDGVYDKEFKKMRKKAKNGST